ncbi:MAG TPA: ABC transporter permease [Lachnospiraceae bacterium]|nr:ABC transporter permease [Lachnospiraceae bacterium]
MVIIMYVIKLACKNIVNRRRTYTLIALQIMIGVLALGVFINLLLSIRSAFVRFDNDIRFHTYYINPNGYHDFNFSDSSIGIENASVQNQYNSYSNYSMVKEKHDVNAVLYTMANRIVKSDSSSANKEINLFFVTPEFFHLFLQNQVSWKENTIYAGEKALEAMRGKQIDSMLYEGMEQFQNYDVKKNVVTLMNGENYSVQEYSKREDDIFEVFTGVQVQNYRISNSIFLPFELAEQPFFNQVGLTGNTFGIYFDGSEDPQVMMAVLNDLDETLGKDRKTDCSYINPLSIYNVNVDQYREMGQVFIIISAFCVIIVTVGLVAFNLMEFNKRKRSIGIKKSIGAKNSQLLLESMTESCIVTLVSGILGGVVAVVILAMDPFRSSFFVIQIHYPVIFGLIGMAFLIGVIANLGIAIRIRNLNPIEIIKEL